jgi:hypothetical protein
VEGDVARDRRDDRAGVLVGDEAAGDLGVRLGGDDRLRARALEAAPDPIEVECRARPVPSSGVKAGSPTGPAIPSDRPYSRLVEGDGGDLGALQLGQRPHPVEEAVDRDPAVGVFHTRQDRDERAERVRGHPAVQAGVDIARRAARV